MTSSARITLIAALALVSAIALLASAPAAEASWRSIHLRDLDESVLYGMDCPTEEVCVGVGTGADPPEGLGSAGIIVSSRRPAGGASAWRASDWRVTRFLAKGDYVPQLRDVSCPTPRLCVAVANKGHILTTEHPLHGASAWKMIQVPGAGSLRSVSCPSRQLCVAGDYYGRVLVSTDPTGGAATWRMSDVGGIGGPAHPFIGIADLSCPSARFCASVDSSTVIASDDPPAGSWQLIHGFESPTATLYTLECPTASLCLAGGREFIYSSAEPADPLGAWPEAAVAEGSVRAIDCPTAGFCAATAEAGEVYFTTSPATGPWARSRRFRSRDAALRSLSCPAPESCLAGGRNGFIAISY